MMRWKPNRHSNYISYIGRQAREVLPRFQNVCDVHLRQGIAVGPSHAQHFEEKKKKGADATTNRTAVGQSLAANHACPLGDIFGFGFGLAEVKSVMAVRTAVVVCA